jgi:2-aminoadipate transaminase
VVETGDLKQNIASLVRVFRQRMERMDSALRRELPKAEFSTPSGGYFFWLHLPGSDTQELRRNAQIHQVDFRPGSLFSSRGGLRDYLRLSISFYDVEEIGAGIKRLAGCLRT